MEAFAAFEEHFFGYFVASFEQQHSYLKLYFCFFLQSFDYQDAIVALGFAYPRYGILHSVSQILFYQGLPFSESNHGLLVRDPSTFMTPTASFL